MLASIVFYNGKLFLNAITKKKPKKIINKIAQC